MRIFTETCSSNPWTIPICSHRNTYCIILLLYRRPMTDDGGENIEICLPLHVLNSHRSRLEISYTVYLSTILLLLLLFTYGHIYYIFFGYFCRRRRVFATHCVKSHPPDSRGGARGTGTTRYLFIADIIIYIFEWYITANG